VTEPIRPAAPQPVPAFAAPPRTGYAIPGQPLVYRPGLLPPPRPTGPGGEPLAEFWERLLAYLLDRLVIGAFLLIPMVIAGVLILRKVFHGVQVAADSGTQVDLGTVLGGYALFWVLILVLQLIGSFCYEALYMTARHGQTVGKRALKLRVIRVDGAELDLRTTAVRWGMQYPLGFVPGYQWLDGLWQLWDQPYRQCLHDKVAKTVVVKVVT
jgi:uncharacterized RDD family membrane protein YckC